MTNLKLIVLVATAATCLQFACTSTKTPFLLKKATYQSYVTGKLSSGSNIEIEVAGAEDGVIFESIVFRRQLIPVSTEKLENGNTLVTGHFIRHSAEIEDHKPEVVNQSDRLNYTVNGKENFIQLNDFERKPVKIVGGY